MGPNCGALQMIISRIIALHLWKAYEYYGRCQPAIQLEPIKYCSNLFYHCVIWFVAAYNKFQLFMFALRF